MAPDSLLQLPTGEKPKVVLKDGEQREVGSDTSDRVYTIKRTDDHYWCECPAWKMQGAHPVNARTCKHLKKLLGANYEEARIKWKNPGGPAAKVPKGAKGKAAARTSAKAGSKRKSKNDNDEEEEEPQRKRNKVAHGPSRMQANQDPEDSEDEDEDQAPVKAAKAPPVLLAVKWDLEKGCDPTGYWVSEKLDGVRTWFDGKLFLSRLGNPFDAPNDLIKRLPKDVILDGELFAGRGNFQDAVSIVRSSNSPGWKKVIFKVFDIPSMKAPFEERMEELKRLFGSPKHWKTDGVEVVEQTLVEDKEHVMGMLEDIEREGGEGLMLRKAGSMYEGKRSSTLLKIKTFHDAEARVIGYVGGQGKHSGSTGALKCEMECGKKFNVGTGLSDKERRSPPKIGSIIVYRFQELTRSGFPRFPSYIGLAIDKSEPKDAVTGQDKDVDVDTCES